VHFALAQHSMVQVLRPLHSWAAHVFCSGMKPGKPQSIHGQESEVSEVKRYEIHPLHFGNAVISEKVDGFWIAAQDYDALAAELEEAKHESEARHQSCLILGDSAAKYQAERDRLRAALGWYGVHAEECRWYDMGSTPETECNCGLSEALRGATPQPEAAPIKGTCGVCGTEWTAYEPLPCPKCGPIQTSEPLKEICSAALHGRAGDPCPRCGDGPCLHRRRNT
jgi:hypothetical protein